MDDAGHQEQARDHTEQSTASTSAKSKKGRKDKSANSALDQLTTVLAQLEQEPNNVPVLRQQITLLQQLQMVQEAYDAVVHLSTLIMLDQKTWMNHLTQLVESFESPLTLERFLDVIERFGVAEEDYLSFAILQQHEQFILQCTNGQLSVDPELAEFLSTDTVRGMLKDVVDRGSGLLSQSQQLWQPYLDWEVSIAQIPADLEHLHEVFLSRLAVPHLDMEATSSAYSAFCSQHCPDDYETRLVHATEASQAAKHKIQGEKRFGTMRYDLEQNLTTSDPLAVFSTYIDWEADPRAKNPKNPRAPSSDAQLTAAVFERAVQMYAEAAEAIVESSADAAAARAYKEAEARMWSRYALWTEDAAKRSSIRQRAVRACPQIGAAWVQLLQEMEVNDPSAIAAIIQRGADLNLMSTPKDLADIFAFQAASEMRRGSEDVINTFGKGFEAIHTVEKSGDTALQLEILLLEWAESSSPDELDQALTLVGRPSKARSASHRLALMRSGIEQRRGNAAAAREILNAAIQRSDLDWPEAIFEAMLRLEMIHGSLDTLAATQIIIDEATQKLTRRRAKEVEQQMAQYDYSTVQPIEATAPDVPMENGVEESTAKAGPSVERDRENTTILVRGLPLSIETTAIESFFETCGHIRETSILPGESSAAALVEFRFADAVPTAINFDRRKLQGQEISVSMLWRSNLYVTNFPEDMKDEGIRELFGQYGNILQTRWPSRKYRDTRHFCYITMETPAAAQEALILHGMQMGDFGLTVVISDPSARKARTDAAQAVSTVFVGGLTAKTSEQDVRDLLEPFGDVRTVKLGWDPIKSMCKGFAFVGMATEAEAKAALALTGTERAGRFLKVEMNDPNFAAKKKDHSTSGQANNQAAERRARTVRLHGLPERTQEGLLQQALEHLVPVKRLEIFSKSHEAIAELTIASDVGKLLLRNEPFVFNGATLTISQQSRRTEHADEKARQTPSTSLNFAPRAARRGKALGKAPAIPRSTAEKPQGGSENQDSFRNFVQSTNAQRDKRPAEDGEGESAKRQKNE